MSDDDYEFEERRVAATDLADEIEAMFSEDSPEDYIAQINLNGSEDRTIRVVVDGSLCWDMIAALYNEGRTEQQIIMHLQMWGFFPHRGAVWTPAAVKQIQQRALAEGWGFSLARTRQRAAAPRPITAKE